MRQAMRVNDFEVEFYTDGYPMWTKTKYKGEQITSMHHTEVKDLEYALGRIRDMLRAKLQPEDKHEA